jgi:ubiquinone/menaquinone biosynthesis C-methylase UbiE
LREGSYLSEVVPPARQRQRFVKQSSGHRGRRLAKRVFAACAALGLSTGEPIDHRFSKRLEWRTIDRYLGLTGHESVCDVGCGDGNWTRRLGRNSRITVGVDLNWRVARWAAVKTHVHELRARESKGRFAKFGAGPIFVCSDAQKLPFASASFDRLASICVLEHLDDDMQALQEMARVLKPGGIAALTVDSLSHPQGPRGHFLEQYRTKHSIRRCYRVEDLERMALEGGFEVEESRYLVNSKLSNLLHSLWAEWDLTGVHADRIETLFPWSYWLALLSDSLFGQRDSGAFLAVKLRRTERP